MGCLRCGTPQDRGKIGVCPGCQPPQIGRPRTPSEALYALLLEDEQALMDRARACFLRSLEGKTTPARADRAWLALTPRHRQLEADRVLEVAREAAGVPSPPVQPGKLEVVR